MKKAITFLFLLSICIGFVNAQANGKIVNPKQMNLLVPCSNDVYEPNNVVDEASAISAVHNYLGLICDENDVDWYSIKLWDNIHNVKIMVSDCPKDYDVEVYDKHMNLIGGSYVKAVTNEVVTLSFPAKGDYFIKIFGHQKAFDINATYALRYFVTNIPTPKSNSVALKTQNTDFNTDIELFPNPAINYVKLNYTTETEGLILINVYDHVGKLINKISDLHYTGLNTHTLDVSYLPNGFYMLEVNVNNQKQLKKLTIDRK